jgi:hypothetical protein
VGRRIPSEKDQPEGEAIAVKLYKDHDLAELRVTKSAK